ncbi:hypothetical protein O6H91_17G019900 [Diphasiastrum complanatum]|uniref:Uncharacterized protein n=1 Tax=Diphasiastrum complanatum TaxID=34168 RepID=A0ACC2B5R0_DIPCM|nr:hypothetical protein O6H91_17G019900 [Diphasiastrum complanatum]
MAGAAGQVAAGPPEESAEEGGELLFCGGTAWDSIGRRQAEATAAVLSLPTRLKPLCGVPISFVAAGSASCHCVALDPNGRCFTWGRNEKGQLGLGDLHQRDMPTIVSALSKFKIVKAGSGRQHTVVVTDDGHSLAFGFNKHGQLGAGFVKEEAEKLPVKCLVAEATHAVCGADFTVWLSSASGASILSAGLPQYGQLGHGTDNEYNAKESSVRLVYEAQPRPRAIAAFTGKTVTKVACGNNHSVAVDSNGFVYTWGFGGHGRLGHKEQKDEWTPRLIETFQRNNVLPPSAVVAAGSAYSACTAGGGQLYMWGRVKATGDNWMYPKPVLDLSGWSIRSMDCGNTSSVAAAEESCISWGTAVHGELGYGPTGPKSSANPKKIDALEGMHVTRVACGLAHTLLVVDGSKCKERLDQFAVYEGPKDTEGTLKPKESEAVQKQVVGKSGKKRKSDATEAADGDLKGKKKPSKKKATLEDGAGADKLIADKKVGGKSSKKTSKDVSKLAGNSPKSPRARSSKNSKDDTDSEVDEESNGSPEVTRARGRDRFKSVLARGRKKQSSDTETPEISNAADKSGKMTASKRGRGRGRGRGRSRS